MAAIHIDRLLETAVRASATDLFILPEHRPMLRVDGALRALEARAPSAGDVEQLVQAVAPEDVRQRLAASGAAQWAFSYEGKARFRARCLRHRTGFELALRCHPLSAPLLDTLGLPPIVQALCRRPRGLFLVVGPAGGGKTTVLAALLDYVNQQVGDRRIVAIEPATEFLPAQGKCPLIQQEVVLHGPDGVTALRQAVSGWGDVLVLGDFSDLAVRHTALDLAGRDCLVLAEWPEVGVVHALQRWLDEVPPASRAQLRSDLATGLLAVLHYELCPRTGTGGLVPAFEFLVTTPEIAGSIREGELDQLPAAMQSGRKYGMCVLDDSLWALLQAGSITAMTALGRSRDPAALQARLERKLRGDDGGAPPPEPDPFPVRPKSPPPSLSGHKEPEDD